MSDQNNNIIRCYEYSTKPVPALSKEQREDIWQAVKEWSSSVKIPDYPLEFHGPDGNILATSHFVGMIEVGDICIEIYPKFDNLINEEGSIYSEPLKADVMKNLLWMMETCCFLDINETDTASLALAPLTYYDLFAYLMTKELRNELEAGLAHYYLLIEDDLRSIRGRINIINQITTNWNRLDRISCIWDEFTPDIPLNRVFKCACRFLQSKVTNPLIIQLLGDCDHLMDEVTYVDPRTALSQIGLTRWHSSNDRFKRCFEFAIRLLEGISTKLSSGVDRQFIFLIDMNILFENFVKSVLEDIYNVKIYSQIAIGHLFKFPKKIGQFPDFVWQRNSNYWIGDAKYKRLSEIGGLSPDDIRQLTVYAEIYKKENALTNPPSIAIFYPCIDERFLSASKLTAWNDSSFWRAPVLIVRPKDGSAKSCMSILEDIKPVSKENGFLMEQN